MNNLSAGMQTENFKDIIESITDYFLVLDKNLNIIYANHMVYSFFGYPAGELFGCSLLEIFPEVRGSDAEKIYREVISSGLPKFFIHDFSIQDKSRSFEISAYPSKTGITIIGKDITEYRLAVEAGRHSEILYRTTLDSLMEGCAIFAPDWRYLYVNETNARHAHHTREQLLGKKLMDVFPGVENSPIFKAYDRVMKSRIPEQIINDFTFADGSLSWFEIKIVPVPDGIFILSSDITERKKHEEQILRYQSVLNQTEKMAHLGSWWIDNFNPDTIGKNKLMWSDEVYNIFGVQDRSMELTEEIFLNSVHPDDKENMIKEITEAVVRKRPLSIEHRIVLPDGTVKRVMENGIIKYDKLGKPCGFIGAVQDVTEFREAAAQRELLVKEIATERDKLKTIIESLPQEVWLIDSQDQKVTINQAIKNNLGLDPSREFTIDELISILNIRSDDGKIRTREETPLLRSLSGEILSGDEIIVHPVTGETRYRHYHSAPIRDDAQQIKGVVAIVNDITEQKKTEEFIKASLREKETLLKELYHRTKNNMQVISSLLGLKAAAAQDKTISTIVEEMNNRIHAIALVHQKLYQSGNLSKIDLAEYISDLIKLLVVSYSPSPEKINVELNLQPINVLLDTAVPCGLVVNELISNSLKFAFPGIRKGSICVKLSTDENKFIDLTVSDNGIGLNDKQITENPGLGLQLFRMIAEDQLQAAVTLSSNNGTSWNIRFRDVLYQERI